ncbi:MAG: hypothetical protein HYT12_01000, partial [Candidatus Liptonbacteria bacterium]|nr:hypothetical protein [Candidatus Liptonbacteria bacterium]
KTGKPLLAPLGILGLVALLSTYAPLAVSVKNILVYDFKFSRVTAGAVVVVAPIAAYLFGARNFLTLVALSGGVFLAFESFVIVLIWNKLNALGKERILLKNYGKKTAYFVAAVFAVGMIYEIVSFISKFLF